MRRVFLLATIVLSVAGCSSERTATQQTAAQPLSPSREVLALEGPGGKVSLGDDLATAKKAYPPIEGAEVFDQSMNYAILGTEGWSWAHEKRKTGFEAALKAGKIFAFAVTDMAGAPATDATAKLSEELGEPTRKASGKTAEALVWEVGEDARIVVILKEKGLLLGPGTMTLIGPKKDLAMLSFRADDPETIVRIMDAGAEQASKLKL